ncbi:MAG TPA: hypothetical protein VGF89_12320 [Steroidobacteraceae bacterium]|jgi:hypothetical protein
MTARARRAWLLPLAATASIASAWADQGPSSDQLAVSGNASELTGNHGGGGGSLAWLHNFTPSTLIDVAGEYEALVNSHWEFGSLTASTTFGDPGEKTSLYAEGHEGRGDIGPHHPFDYQVVAAGGVQSLGKYLAVQLEDRQFDIDTSHGNLPKLGIALSPSPRFTTTLAYAYTAGGNLGTNLLSVRFDAAARRINWLAGAAFGTASPAVVNLETGFVEPSKRLNEGYAGLVLPVARGKLTLVADYLDLAGFRRTTVTLSYIVPIGSSGARR